MKQILITAICLAGLYGYPAITSAGVCNDVPTTHWAYPTIESTASIMQRCRSDNGFQFIGAQLVSRYDMARYTQRLFKENGFDIVSTGLDTIEDVPSDHPDYTAVSAVVNSGLMELYDGKFYGSRLINRFQLAVYISKILKKGNVPVPPAASSRFPDMAPDHWAATAVDQAVRAGILKGYNDQFYGKKLLNHYQISVVFALLNQALSKATDTNTAIALKSSPLPAGSKTPAHPSVDFGAYYALVIGNDEYEHLQDLKTAVSDARALAALLRDRYGFKVNLMTNASRAEILVAINAYRRTLTARDNLMIYYAGHGWLDRDADQGYWLPVNATEDNPVEWLSNSAITDEIRAIEAKHVMVVADSCYSGKLSRGLQINQKKPDFLTRMISKKARVVLSSGGLEPVMDGGGNNNHSVFASAFIQVLRENSGILDGVSLFTQVREKVGWNAEQIPEYAPIHKAGHDGGDFFFVAK